MPPMLLLGGLPLGPGRGDGCLGSRGAAAGVLVDAHRVPVPRPGRVGVGYLNVGRADALVSSLVLVRPAGGVKQTYPRVGAVLQLAAATACGTRASGLRH